MKKMITAILAISVPVLLMAAETEIEVPGAVTELIGGTVDKFVTGTFVMSTGFVAAVQIIKKIMEKFRVEIGGVKSQLLTVAIGITYAVIDTGVWQDGNISSADIVSMTQAAIAVVSGVFGYKLLWKQPSACVKPLEKQEK